jgi:hypothetical protein
VSAMTFSCSWDTPILSSCLVGRAQISKPPGRKLVPSEPALVLKMINSKLRTGAAYLIVRIVATPPSFALVDSTDPLTRVDFQHVPCQVSLA